MLMYKKFDTETAFLARKKANLCNVATLPPPNCDVAMSQPFK